MFEVLDILNIQCYLLINNTIKNTTKFIMLCGLKLRLMMYNIFKWAGHICPVCHSEEPSNQFPMWVPLALWVECLIRNLRVMGLISIWDSELVFFPIKKSLSCQNVSFIICLTFRLKNVFLFVQLRWFQITKRLT